MAIGKTRSGKIRSRKKASTASVAAARVPARAKAASRQSPPVSMSHLIDEAAVAGLLAGEKSEHVTARTTRALLAAARRQTGIASVSKLIEVALAALALPDPVARFMREHRGELGRDHGLEY